MAQTFKPGQPVMGKQQEVHAPRIMAAAHARTDLEAGAASRGRPVPEVLQAPCCNPALPPEIRMRFVVKVYAILGAMLAVSFGVTVPFVFATQSTLAWFSQHVWLLALVSLTLMVQYIFNSCMACEMCCGGTRLVGCYMSMMKRVPFNYIYLFTFAGCFGVVLGFICAQYSATSVLLVFAMALVIVLALTVYAVVTKADFTTCGPYILVALLGLFLILLVANFFPAQGWFRRLAAGIGAMIFGCLIVHDTQLIFGSASLGFGGGKRALEYTIDMYAFAAWNLYLDFLNFFIFLLQVLGDRHE